MSFNIVLPIRAKNQTYSQEGPDPDVQRKPLQAKSETRGPKGFCLDGQLLLPIRTKSKTQSIKGTDDDAQPPPPQTENETHSLKGADPEVQLPRPQTDSETSCPREMDPDARLLFNLHGFVCGCPELWSHLSVSHSGQSLDDPANQLVNILNTTCPNAGRILGLLKTHQVSALEPHVAPGHQAKETCIFWYHGKCTQGKLCKRKHELNHNWPISVPPGFTHGKCMLQFCPFRTDLVEFIQKHHSTLRAEREKQEAAKMAEYNEEENDHKKNYVSFGTEATEVSEEMDEAMMLSPPSPYTISANTSSSRAISATNPFEMPESTDFEPQIPTRTQYGDDDEDSQDSEPYFKIERMSAYEQQAQGKGKRRYEDTQDTRDPQTKPKRKAMPRTKKQCRGLESDLGQSSPESGEASSDSGLESGEISDSDGYMSDTQEQHGDNGDQNAAQSIKDETTEGQIDLSLFRPRKFKSGKYVLTRFRLSRVMNGEPMPPLRKERKKKAPVPRELHPLPAKPPAECIPRGFDDDDDDAPPSF